MRDSINSVWPLPSTPAMPTISPARTSNDTPRTFGDAAVVRGVQIGHDEQRLGRLRRSLLDAQDDVAPDHHPGELRLGGALACDGADLPAAPEHGDAVGDLEHLVQLVADEDDRHVLRRQRAEDGEQILRLLRRQDGGRLVEDEDVRVPVERLQDLDALLLRPRSCPRSARPARSGTRTWPRSRRPACAPRGSRAGRGLPSARRRGRYSPPPSSPG